MKEVQCERCGQWYYSIKKRIKTCDDCWDWDMKEREVDNQKLNINKIYENPNHVLITLEDDELEFSDKGQKRFF